MNTDNSPIIGIDLGTTNSEVAVLVDGRIDIVREDGDPMLPSYVGLSPDNRLLVGHPARNQYLVDPHRTIRSVKRRMGSSDPILLGDKTYLPQEISAMILRELKARAERALGQPVSRAVITVPAYFSDAQRQATREAGQLAGLEVLRILNEPTAACLAYESAHNHEARTVLAYDLGGGTFDVSVVKIEGDLVEVIASHGDNHLGGDDFDDLLRQELLDRLSARADHEIVLDDVAACRLRHAAEQAKIRLADDSYTRVIEDHLRDDRDELIHLDEEISRNELDELLAPLLDKTVEAIHKALRDAHLTPRHLDEVILVGGSTRLGAVAALIEKELGLAPRRDVHPDLAVALGAGVMAARLAGSTDQRILVDITPYTFGTSAVGWLRGNYTPHFFVPIIKAGSPLPVSRSEAFATLDHGQPAVDVTIFQGDQPDARRNLLIGHFMVEGLDPDAPAGSTILIHMQLDLDGILRVTATEKATGLQRDVTIEHSLQTLTHDQIQQSRREIAELFGDAHDDLPPAEPDTTDTDPALTAILARLAKAADRLDPVDAADAARLVDDLSVAVDADDLDTADRIRQELEDLLFYVETQ